MVQITNEFGQPVGAPLGAWSGARTPTSEDLIGQHVRLRRLEVDADTPELFSLFAASDPAVWTYLPVGPFAEEGELREIFAALTADPTNAVYTIVVDGTVAGFLEYLRIAEHQGTIEIGFITFSPDLQRSTAATETLWLMMRNAFELGYRRLEWKCDALNEKSQAAARRLGFQYEGTFRQATHYKGRNRDTAWFSIIDSEWPTCAEAFTRWLADDNFDPDGRQRRSLGELRSETTPG